MKFVIATLIAGGTLVSADLPNVGSDECAIVSTDIAAADPTFINPEPVATSMRLIVYCGQLVPNSSGAFLNQRALKYIDVDLAQAEILVEAARDLLGDDGVFLPEN